MITVEKISECHLKVMGDQSDEADIKQFFTFKSKGYQFTPRYKSGVWNGDISVYDQRSKILPAGLFPRLESFMDETGIEYQIRENSDYSLDDHDQIGMEELKDFLADLDVALPRDGVIREYQFDAIHKAICQKKITLISPTSCLDPEEEIELFVSDEDYGKFLASSKANTTSDFHDSINSTESLL